MGYRAEGGVTSTPMYDGGLVLLAERSGKLFRCNPTAAAMWTALREHDGQEDAAVAAVAQQYGTDPARVRADMEALIDKLRRDGLLGVEP